MNGTGVFAAYFIGQKSSGPRVLRRLKKVSGVYTVESFGALPQPNTARTIEFDPISGDLFVSEESSDARIWRFNKDGARQIFGDRFKEPLGIAFHPSGVMLVTEDHSVNVGVSNVLVVGGWRNRFKRGDANGDGTVDISDSITISNWLQDRTKPVACFDGADANDDSKISDDPGISDPDYILDYLFNDGPEPPNPGPNGCGRDPTPDLLDCTKSLGTRCEGGNCAIQ